ncbi:MAG: glycosyltransferase [Proteobacteria bacterium]|nr:glycosyltransferase [Pseudomonadota bacterium]
MLSVSQLNLSQADLVMQLLLGLLSCALLLEIWLSHRWLRAAVGFGLPRRPLPAYPSLTVIRPIRGLDTEAEENLAAAFAHGYPGAVQTIFVFDDEHEPALPLARAAIAAEQRAGHPDAGVAEVIVCGAPPPGRTGKLNAMLAGLARARGELIVFADSDIRPGGKALTALVETLLGTPRAGAAFAPVVVTPRPQTMGDAGYALLLNALYGAAAAAASRKHEGELPFIMGQFMAFRRETIAAIGGLESADGQLVDDMYLGARVRAVGYRNMMSPVRVPVIQRGLSLSQFASLYRRWMIFSRSGLPGWSFKRTPLLHGIAFWLGLVIAAYAFAEGTWGLALGALAVPAAVAASINRLHRALGGGRLAPRHALVPFGLLLVAPLIFATIWLNLEVAWRGRTYRLNASSRLAEGEALEAADDSPSALHRRRPPTTSEVEA